MAKLAFLTFGRLGYERIVTRAHYFADIQTMSKILEPKRDESKLFSHNTWKQHILKRTLNHKIEGWGGGCGRE